MAMSQRKRLTQVLDDALLAPLLARHFAHVHAEWLRSSARDAEPAVGNELRHAANQLERRTENESNLTTLVLNRAQRMMVSEAIGDAPKGDDARRLAAMLRSPRTETAAPPASPGP